MDPDDTIPTHDTIPCEPPDTRPEPLHFQDFDEWPPPPLDDPSLDDE